MTEKQAWWKIGVAFETERENRTDKQKDIASNGLCMATIILRRKGIITSNIEDTMDKKTYKSQKSAGSYFCSTKFRRNDYLRALFCYLQYYAMGGE